MSIRAFYSKLVHFPLCPPLEFGFLDTASHRFLKNDDPFHRHIGMPAFVEIDGLAEDFFHV